MRREKRGLRCRRRGRILLLGRQLSNPSKQLVHDIQGWLVFLEFLEESIDIIFGQSI
jgi:hypothetical protein